MRSIWVLVADNSQASMYQFRPNQHSLHLLDSIHHEQERWHTGDFITDKPGYSTRPSTTNNMADRESGTADRSPKATEKARFTQTIAKAINHAYSTNSFESLQVCAPPGFMGALLPKLKKSVPLKHKVTKDLTMADSEQIMSHLSPLTLG